MTAPKVWATTLGLLLYCVLTIYKPMTGDDPERPVNETRSVLACLGPVLYIISNGAILGSAIKWTWCYALEIMRSYQVELSNWRCFDQKQGKAILFRLWLGYLVGSHVLNSWASLTFCTDPTASNCNCKARLRMTSFAPVVIAALVYKGTTRYFEDEDNAIAG